MLLVDVENKNTGFYEYVDDKKKTKAYSVNLRQRLKKKD